MEHRKEKTKRLKEQREAKDMAECTFKPKTWSKKVKERNFEEFLRDQALFEEKRAEKKLIKVVEENVYRP